MYRFISIFLPVIVALPVFAQVVEKRQRNQYDSVLVFSDCAVKTSRGEHIFSKLEIFADFPGGVNQWLGFANKNFQFEAIQQHLDSSGKTFFDSLVVKFIVTRQGKICDVKMKKGNAVLLGPTMKLLHASPGWHPGTSAGRQLNSYRTLRLDVFIDPGTNTKEIKRLYNSYSMTND